MLPNVSALLAMRWLGTLFGCGGGITPPVPEATAVARLAGGLTTLHGFPALPGLRRLHLGHAPITSLAGLPELPELTQLTVVGSKLDSLASLRPQPKLANIVAPGLVEVRGILGKAWRSAGHVGMYQVVVQAMDGDAEGVAVNLVNAIK